MGQPIRIAHVIYRLDVGGMENGLVNLINCLPADRFTHAILCLTYATDFRQRIRRENVEIMEFQKPDGKHLLTYWRVFRALRHLRPDIVHTRNLGTLDLAYIARLAGSPVRLHGEHGWSAEDPAGTSPKYRRLRRFCDKAVDRYVAVSEDIRRWLVDVIGIADAKVATVHNGVDLARFRKNGDEEPGREAGGRIVFGTVGRQEPIKGLDVFLAAVHDLLEARPEMREAVRIIMAGNGPSHDDCVARRDRYGLQEIIELPGEVTNVPVLLRRFSFFVQPSLNEGISNTVLEAMASGLPVIATAVGGNPELVRDGRTGRLVPPNDKSALRAAIERYVDDACSRREDGDAARLRAEESFSLEAMASNYERLYVDSAAAAGRLRA